MDPNQSENGKYNLISGGFNKISLCELDWARKKSVLKLAYLGYSLMYAHKYTKWQFTIMEMTIKLERDFLVGNLNVHFLLFCDKLV